MRAYEIHRKVLGDNNPDVATDLNNIGSFYLNQKKYDLAQKFFSDALQIDQKIFGTSHMDVAIRLTNLGLLFEEQGLYEKALEFLKKAVEIYEKMRHTELELDKIQVAIDRINKQISD